jgi:hypothetical protein
MREKLWVIQTRLISAATWTAVTTVLLVGVWFDVRGFQELDRQQQHVAGWYFLAAAVVFATFVWLLDTWRAFAPGATAFLANSGLAAAFLSAGWLVFVAVFVVLALVPSKEGPAGGGGGVVPQPDPPTSPSGGISLTEPSKRTARSIHDYDLPA